MTEHDSNRISCDPLTGLKDWRTFFQDVKEGIAHGVHAHVILVQLIQLKRINRKHGIQAGNKLLCDIGEYLKTFDPAYTAYRTNSSRFILLGPDCTQRQAEDNVSRIRARFQEIWPVEAEGEIHEVATKAYFIYFFLDPKDTEIDLLDKMNHAVSVFLAREKRGILFFNEELTSDMLHRRYILSETRYAVENKTFQIYYQPIYDCAEARFTSAESLIRLSGRDNSPISPGEFIPMAEENGLIDAISWIVLEKVCAFLGVHPDLPLKSVSVNMTGQQILDPSFVSRIEQNLEKYRVEGSRLRIEIMERTITDDFAEVRKVMNYLSEKGIRFYLDDFGTGYSNLSSMLSLPFEVIKFDQSLVKMMSDTDKGLKTIGLLTDIMHENEYYVVAEGIETASQVHNAQERRLDRIQGYYYAKPMSGDDLVRFLAAESGKGPETLR